jgi:hypothetical protein
MASGRPSLALLLGYPPPTPTPASHRGSVRTILAKRTHAPPPASRTLEYFVAKKHIGLPEREILVTKYGYHVFQDPPYKASIHVLIMRIAAAGTSFGPMPS